MSTEAWFLFVIALVIVGPWAFAILITVAVLVASIVWWAWVSAFDFLKSMWKAVV